jgi:acetyl esterase/lipase
MQLETPTLMRRWFWIAALLVFAMVAFKPLLFRAVEALLVIEDVAAGPGASRLKEWRAAPIREEITYRVPGKTNTADVYRPGSGEHARAVVVVVPGVVRLGNDDPRIVAFAETMARSRFLVFVPDLQSLRELSIRSEDVDELSALTLYIASKVTGGAEKSVGIVAFSYAAGPAILAAMDPQTRSLVRFVYAIGTYYDIISLGTYLTTGYFREGPDRRWQRQTPSSYATWVFVHSSAAWLKDPSDRRILEAMSEAKLADPKADVRGLAAQLGPEGRALHRLLLNRDPEKAPLLIAELPTSLLAEFHRLDLRSRNMADLKTTLILVHGRDDTLIPYSESIRLAAAADADRTHLFVVRSMAHVELGSSGVLDLWTLSRASYLLLSERDAMPPPVANRFRA